MRWRGRELFEDSNTTLAASIRAQLLGCLIVGIPVAVGFAVIRMPYPLVLGVLAAALEFIPRVGHLIFMGIALLAASVGGHSSGAAVFLSVAALRTLEDDAISPRIVRRGIHLHPLSVILAIPVVAILTTVHRHWLEFEGSDGLVADLLQPVEKAAAAPPIPPEPAVRKDPQEAQVVPTH